ncbi:MAG: NADH-quinone oxidoreductase subunit L [Deltaproteobacteria bacterium]
MVNILDYIWLVPAFPLLGVIANAAIALFVERPLLLAENAHEGHGHPYRKLVSFLGPAVVGAAFVVSVLAVLALAARQPHDRLFVRVLFPWVQAGGFSAPVSFQLDPLSAVMILVVTGVGFLIHVYSVGYMSHEKAFARYFVYLNLFTFAMLLLVLGSNFLLMFVGWEGVGLCSYLLIGYWYEKKSASDAGKKAFIVNRIGDFGFLIAMFLIFWTFGSVEYTEVFARIPGLTESGVLTTAVATAITLLLFVGATGKSAQIPLYVWLPDAMEGPTPVSALIHAATMVTAGVYMVARTNALYLLAPVSMGVVATVGAATAIFSATIGITQNDIKRVLAYSTVSQLGYMFLACGVGAFTAGIFHLMTHAFFKALLFLGSGSVIHALSGEQDMRKMGSLKKYLPVTFATMFIATLAISGIPGLSGFFSKDEILWKAFSSEHGHVALWAVGTLAAGITAFYMFRLVFLTFFGESRMEPEVEKHVHESPYSMTVPLMILAVLSVAGGWIGIPEALGGHNRFEQWLAPVFSHGAEGAAHGAAHHSAALEYLLMAGSVAVALAGIALAWYLYRVRPEKPKAIAEAAPGLYRTVLNKYYVDEIYDAAIVRTIVNGSVWLWEAFDDLFIDGIVNGVASLVRGAGGGLRRIQTGVVGNYAFSVLLGAVVLLGILFWS